MPLAGCGMLTEPKCERGFQFFGTMKRVCSGGLSRPPSGISSSTTAIGGIRGLSLCLLAAIAIAFSKSAFLFRRDSAVYPAAPLRGVPLILGMVRLQCLSQEQPIGVGLLLRVGSVAERSGRTSGTRENLLQCRCFCETEVLGSALRPGVPIHRMSPNPIPINITIAIKSSIEICEIMLVPFPCARRFGC